MNPTYITIHETESGHELSSAEWNYEMYQKRLDNNSNIIGYHFMIEANYNDISKIYQFLELNVCTNHTGDDFGNKNSIGIERLVNVNTDMDRAIDLQAQLTAFLMHKYNIPIENVVPHKKWNGKDCPSRLLYGLYGGWDGFIDKIKEYYKEDFNPNKFNII